MKNKPKHNVDYRAIVLLIFIAGGLIALVRIPHLFGQPERDEETYAANRNRIEQMTQTERDRVKRRAERYFELDEKDRDRIRQLHHDLQHDKDAQELKKVMERYNDWLTSLSPYERNDIRDKLRKAKTAEKKRQIIEDQRNLQFVDTLEGPAREFFKGVSTPQERRERIMEFRETMYRPGMRSGRSSYPAIALEKLGPFFKAIQAKLELKETEKQQLEKLTGAQRSYRIMALALRQRSRQRSFSSGPLSDHNLREMVEEVIDDSELKQKLLGSRKRPLYAVSQALFRHRGKTAGNPTDQQLSNFFANLSPEKRDELMQTGGSDRQRRLRQWYFRSGGDDATEFQAFMSEWFKTMRSWGGEKFRPSRGGRGPHNGKPPERRRPKKPKKTARLRERSRHLRNSAAACPEFIHMHYASTRARSFAAHAAG